VNRDFLNIMAIIGFYVFVKWVAVVLYVIIDAIKFGDEKPKRLPNDDVNHEPGGDK
jgi:hypothetical protein